LKAVIPLVVIFTIIGIAGAMPGVFANTSSSHPFILEWGESGLTKPGFFSFPQNLAVDNLGNVYVTDLGNMRVQKFSSDGTFLKAWGGSGTDQGQFHSPAGIIVYNNTVFVVDTQLHRIQKFDLTGNFISKWGSEGKDQGQFLLPNDIAVGTNGTIYVVDTGNKRIQKFTANGEFISEFGQSGTEDGKFVTPMGIAIDNKDNIYVSDTGKNKIFKFDSKGVFSQSYGPNFAGFQIIPQGLTVAPSGNIYIADTGNDRILLLSNEGTTLTSWGSMGIANGQFKSPKDIALDKNGYLYVTDSNGHRIQKFGSPIIPGITETQPSSTQSTQTTTSTITPIPGDLTKPVITPPNDLFIEATSGLTTVSVGQAMATDPSGIKSLTHNAPPQFPLGTTTIIWTAIDGAGNLGIATQVIKVVDTIPPTITALPEIIVEAESPETNIVTLDEPIAKDAVGVISITNDAPEVFPLGETLVTWTATDVASNSKSVTQKVVVVDTKPPKLIAPQDIVSAATSYNQNEIYLGEAVVVDNGNIMSITNDAPQFFTVGNTTVTWTATDSAGNVASKKQLVSVIDTSVPIITPPENLIIEATSLNENVIDLGTPIVSDIQNVTITNNAPQVFPYGETNVTWLAIDPAGNSATVNQAITVIDTTQPTLVIPDDIVFEATSLDNNIISIGNATASDITGISQVENNSPDVFPFGTTIVTWTATDNVGNSISKDQTVTVIDTTAPQIRAPDDIVLEAMDRDANVVDLDIPWAIDTIGVESYTNDAPASFPIGMTTVTWTAVDTSGNTASDTQVVTIRDMTSPTIVPPSDIVVEATSSSGIFIQIGEADVSDIIGIESVTNNAPSLFSLGNTTVTWTATDIFGNTASTDQTISIIDTTSPTIHVPADLTIEAKDAKSNVVNIGVADATDIVGVISINNNAPGGFPLGDTLVTWTAIDAAGNLATAIQKISVIDTTPPSIQAPETVQIEATSQLNNIVELGEATASDFIGIESITNDAPDVFPVGETVVTWTATDLGGLSSQDTQIVRIVDTTPPKISIPKMITVEATSEDQNVIELEGIFADDFVGVTSITNDAPDVFPFGLTTITWAASDEAGNIATGSQQISVVDTTAPSIIAPSDIEQEASNAQNNLVNLGKPQATDLVSVASITNDAPDAFPLGQTIVTWTVTDSSGNTASATQTVSIIDTTPPTIETPKGIEIEATSSDQNIVSLVPPIASDTVSEITITKDAPNYLPLGETTITWTVTDSEGNSATTTQKVTVVDTTAPELTVPSDIIIDAISLQTPLSVGEGSAIDLAGSDITITNDAPLSFPLGDTVVTWTAVDSFGNSISSSQTITVQACGKPNSYYNMITGSAEDDIISGTNVSDLIFALEGDDIIMGSKGNDCILGGDGDDIIFGNEGNDNLSGGDGSDVLKGQSGDDTITGGLGVDVIDGGDDSDSCNVGQVQDGDLIVKCE
jgi:Ca2+-binding RTX toxin-like protein/sugar lactone lactonase YvrE